MKKYIGLISFLLLVTSAFAQSEEDRGLLWKISGNGLEKPSFLYGTMHVSNKVAFHLSDSFYKAIESVDVVSLEINPETWMETMTTDDYVADNMGNVFSMRGDYSNTGFYKAIFELKAPENKEIGTALGAELGILNSLLYRTSNYSADFQEDTYLDLFIFQAGKKQGKLITGLEHLGNTMRLNEQAAKPETDKKKKKEERELAEKRRHQVSKILDGKNFNEVMEDAYRRGDLTLLDSLSRLSSANDKYHDLIIVYRNNGMAVAMDSIMKTQSLFAGVGAAHLPNSYGVINLLREMGYTVSAVSDKKSDYGRKVKDKLEETFIKQPFSKQTSFDGSYSVNMPGELYEFPEAGNVMMAAYPDMANGATYVITRMFTFGTLYGVSQEDYLEKIDSLLFENIPGKILENKRISIDGIPGFDILNETKKGDFQRYHIMVSPLEIIILKVGGKKEFIKRPEVAAFWEDLHFHQNKTWKEFSPKNNAYTIKMPGVHVYEGENNSFMRGFWKKTVQSYDSDKGTFMVMNRSYNDMNFMEEDSFELSQMCRNFVQQFDYELKELSHDSFLSYPSFNVIATKEEMPDLYLRALVAGNQYYLTVAQTNDEESASTFFNSLKFNDYTFSRSFELKHDSARFFSVETNVKPPIEQGSYYGYYYGGNDDEEDDSHEEETKTAIYYSKESDEAIYVRNKKFHKYYGETHEDSIWKYNKNELTENDDFFLRNEKKWEKQELKYYEIEAGDTNSSRNFLARYILKDGVMYSLFTETDFKKPRSKFVNSFYETFTPWDTAIGTPVLQSKADLFLGDLISEDSTTREAAYRSFYTIQFEDEDADKLISAYSKSYVSDNAMDIRSNLIREIGRTKSPRILPFLQDTYYKIGDSITFQIPILNAIANQQTKKSTKMFAKLILEETPLSEDQDEIDELFYSFYDSLEIARDLYPDILMLTALPEYKSNIYSLLVRTLDSSISKKRVYRKYVKQLAWEANNEVKRQKAREASKGNDFYNEANRNALYNYNEDLEYYAKMLMPYAKKSKVKKVFNRIEKLNSTGLKMDLAVLKLQSRMSVPSGTWKEFANNTNDRIEIYQRLKKINRLDLFPEEYGYDDLAEALFAQRAYINVNKDSLEFIKKEYTIVQKDTGYIYFFKSKSSYDDEWSYGYIGVIDTTQSELDDWGYDFDESISYNKYEDTDLQLRMKLRELQMQDRPRYRVSDEIEFKDLKNTRRRYY
ncbi:MAG: TraB/GumN family protein [Bacteroidia bacterium]|nr:TraB/GumN family protein [Bacteroidia bacterium]